MWCGGRRETDEVVPSSRSSSPFAVAVQLKSEPRGRKDDLITLHPVPEIRLEPFPSEGSTSPPAARLTLLSVLIAILGLPQAGKATLANHLTTAHSFTRVHIAPTSPSTAGALSFPSSSDFLDYATRNWRKDFVTTDLRSRTKLVEFSKRPFVVIVGVEAPLGIRYRRAVAACVLSLCSPTAS